MLWYLRNQTADTETTTRRSYQALLESMLNSVQAIFEKLIYYCQSNISLSQNKMYFHPNIIATLPVLASLTHFIPISNAM